MRTVIIVLTIAVMFLGCAKSGTTHSSLNRTQSKVELPEQSVHFPFNSDQIYLDDLDNINRNAAWMKRNGDAVVILEGHCDEHGDSTYNMELGDRRARSVKAYLIEKGIEHDRIIMVVSYGDTKPIDPSHNNIAWRKNRRVEFIIR